MTTFSGCAHTQISLTPPFLPFVWHDRLVGLAAGDKGVEVKGGVLRFHQCMAEQKGGGLSVVAGNIMQSSGVLEFMDCGAGEGFESYLKGGGLALENGNLVLEDAIVRVQGCRADAGGGFFLEEGHLLQDGGHLHVGDCNALSSGGGILIDRGTFSLMRGIAEFTLCVAAHVADEMEMDPWPWLHNLFEQAEEEEEDEEDETKHNLRGSSGLGGGLWVEKGQVDQRGGNLSFSSCSSYRGGGMALSRGTIRQHGGMMSFHDCTAKQNGGGMFVDHGSAFVEGHVSSCFAARLDRLVQQMLRRVVVWPCTTGM